jgi:hypothetical protein
LFLIIEALTTQDNRSETTNIKTYKIEVVFDNNVHEKRREKEKRKKEKVYDRTRQNQIPHHFFFFLFVLLIFSPQ